MRSEKFHVKYDTDYVLFAIRSKIEDYQLAYFLNKSSSFLFKRMSPDVSFLLNKRPVYFSSFYDYNDELKRESFLIKNRSIYTSRINSKTNLFSKTEIANTAFLLPELKGFDYFLKLVGIWKKAELLDLRRFLNCLKVVESGANINLSQLQSINNLVF
tara:strand:- start:3419 stop:3892 length:474 start_codon:yes stop_codon:yes gene_type:complete